jgi:hypothetical protein
MSLIAKGNTVCILLGIKQTEKPGLRHAFEAPNKKTYGERFSTKVTKPNSIIGKIEEINEETCKIHLGNYKRGVGFIPGNNEVTYSIEYLRELERFRYIKLLV